MGRFLYPVCAGCATSYMISRHAAEETVIKGKLITGFLKGISFFCRHFTTASKQLDYGYLNSVLANPVHVRAALKEGDQLMSSPTV